MWLSFSCKFSHFSQSTRTQQFVHAELTRGKSFRTHTVIWNFKVTRRKFSHTNSWNFKVTYYQKTNTSFVNFTFVLDTRIHWSRPKRNLFRFRFQCSDFKFYFSSICFDVSSLSSLICFSVFSGNLTKGNDWSDSFAFCQVDAHFVSSSISSALVK